MTEDRTNDSIPKPSSYKVICISLYTDDMRELDAFVDRMKSHVPRASRSALIRIALRALDEEHALTELRKGRV